MTNQELADKLRELDKVATPAPWEAVIRWISDSGVDKSIMSKNTWADTNDDWELIVSLRNNLPAIIEALSAKPIPADSNLKEQAERIARLFTNERDITVQNSINMTEQILAANSERAKAIGRAEGLEMARDAFVDHVMTWPFVGDWGYTDEEMQTIVHRHKLEEARKHRKTADVIDVFESRAASLREEHDGKGEYPLTPSKGYNWGLCSDKLLEARGWSLFHSRGNG